MQISAVPFVNVTDTRETSSVAASDKTELTSRDSSLSAVSEPTENDSSGRQSEQKPTQEAISEAEFTDQELKQIRQLESRDREVRAHEQAHQAVGGQYAGSATYTYQRGPDGVSYAIGGEVPIDVSKVAGDPEATIQKADVVRRAALAPAEPSAQDRRVASLAAQIKLEAQSELAEVKAEEAREPEDEAASVEETTDADSQAASSAENSANNQDDSNQSDTNASVSVQGSPERDASSQSESSVGTSTDSGTQVEFDNGALSPQDFVNLLASDLARKNAMAVFENINREPPKGELDELV